MPEMASPVVTLGKDCTITVGGVGSINNMVRSVSYAVTAKEIELHEFGSLYSATAICGHTLQVDMELVADPSLHGNVMSGEIVTITGSWASGNYVITNAQRQEPIDDVVTISITAKGTIGVSA